MVMVEPSRFAGRDREGDFAWMIRQPAYADALFVFNDNEEAFLEHLRHGPNAECSASAGNAVIRPEQYRSHPRAAGIPTGRHGAGYPRLDDPTKAVIDQAFDRIDELLDTGRYSRLIFSADAQGRLGVSIFSPGDDVIEYMTGRLIALARD